MYSGQSTALCIFQDYDPECAIGDHVNAKAEPLRSLAEFKFKTHGPYMRHYKLDWEQDWQWDSIKGDKPRSFNGSFILLLDKPPQDILKYTRVDLRNSFKGTITIKEMQELDTVTDLIVLGVHGNTNSASVASLLHMGLAKAETDLLFRKALYEEEGKGPQDYLAEMATLWIGKTLIFPI
jgi:hypothetical protein